MQYRIQYVIIKFISRKYVPEDGKVLQWPGLCDVSAQAAAADNADNTDPNNAQVVVTDTKVNGTISTAGEMRWYAFVMNQAGKATIRVEMGADLDTDLYIFKLNEATSRRKRCGRKR